MTSYKMTFTPLYFFLPLFVINKRFFVTCVTHFTKSSVHSCLANFYSRMQCVVCVVMDSYKSLFCNNPAYDLDFTDTSSLGRPTSFFWPVTISFNCLCWIILLTDIWLQHATVCSTGSYTTLKGSHLYYFLLKKFFW